MIVNTYTGLTKYCKEMNAHELNMATDCKWYLQETNKLPTFAQWTLEFEIKTRESRVYT